MSEHEPASKRPRTAAGPPEGRWPVVLSDGHLRALLGHVAVPEGPCLSVPHTLAVFVAKGKGEQHWQRVCHLPSTVRYGDVNERYAQVREAAARAARDAILAIGGTVERDKFSDNLVEVRRAGDPWSAEVLQAFWSGKRQRVRIRILACIFPDTVWAHAYPAALGPLVDVVYYPADTPGDVRVMGRWVEARALEWIQDRPRTVLDIARRAATETDFRIDMETRISSPAPTPGTPGAPQPHARIDLLVRVRTIDHRGQVVRTDVHTWCAHTAGSVPPGFPAYDAIRAAGDTPTMDDIPCIDSHHLLTVEDLAAQRRCA